MVERSWYVVVGGEREGPIWDSELRERIARGQVNAETLVWTDTMTEWTKAGSIPGLIPPGVRAAPQAVVLGQSGGPLQTTVGTWPLFGRFLLVVIGQLLIIPAPWTMTSFYRWFIDGIELPIARKAHFAGQPGDIWYIFILSAILGYGGFVHAGLPFVLLPITTLLSFVTLRWLLANLRWDGRGEPLRFTGSYWGLLGWMAFIWVAFISIIGWAWVSTAAARWTCRNIEGSGQQLIFVATGWGLLWRTLLFALACSLIIPIPWVLAWFTRWTVSQFHLVSRVQ